MQTKPIEGYAGRYTINEHGEIYSLLSNKYLSRCADSHGYPLVVLCTETGKRKTCKVHRLVALHFIPNPNNLPVINHIDGNKLNSLVSNLEWCTHQHNAQHAVDMGLSSPTGREQVLTDERLAACQMAYDHGIPIKELTILYGVSRGAIEDYINFGTESRQLHITNGIKARSHKINQFTLDGLFIREWESMSQAARELEINQGSISNACRGRIKTAGGYRWQQTYN